MLGNFLQGFMKRAEDSSEKSYGQGYVGAGALLGGLVAGGAGAASRIGKQVQYKADGQIKMRPGKPVLPSGKPVPGGALAEFLHGKPGKPVGHQRAYKVNTPLKKGLKMAPLGALAGALLGLGVQKFTGDGDKTAESSTPPMLARTISKAGPRADDITAESDRTRF